jgi:hypothetical protein
MVYKSTHVIDNIKFKLDKIWCVCGWEGTQLEYKQHKLDAPPLDRETINQWKVMYGSRGGRNLPNQSVMREMSGFLDNIKE